MSIKIDPSYLEAFLLSRDAKVAIDRMKTGINDSGLNLTHSRFLKLIVPLAPIREQQRILSKIDELQSKLDNAIECLVVAEKKQKNFYQAVLDNAFFACTEERKLGKLLSKKLSNGYSGKPVNYETAYKVLSLSSTTTGIFLDRYHKFLDEDN